MSFIQIQQIHKIYEGRKVVDDVSMTIEQGSVTVIVGTSGSGKSTLLKMINRLVDPSEGRILIDGQDITQVDIISLRREIGYVIQGNGLFPHQTIAQNIGTVPKLLQWPKSRIEQRVDDLLALFDLDPSLYATQYPHQLSGGQQQRVGVARAIAAEPKVLLMDEPFGALDPVIRAKAQDDLLNIQRRLGVTIVLVTHDMDEAFYLGNKIGIMNSGRLLQYDTPQNILIHPTDPFCIELTGTSNRALKLLSLTAVSSAMTLRASEPFVYDTRVENDKANEVAHQINILIQKGLPRISMHASLREALSELTWQGQTELLVVNEDQQVVGMIDMPTILRLGQGQSEQRLSFR